MADPLKLLREYILAGKYIGQIDDLICFGKIGFAVDTPTNFEIWNRKGEYYTLEALLFFSKNKDLTHPDYVKEVVKIKPKGDSSAKLQVVTRADRKDVIDYLTREKLDKIPPSINSSIPAPVPVKLSADQIKQIEEKQASESGKRVRHDADEQGPSKRARLEDEAAAADQAMDATSAVDNLENELAQFAVIKNREREWVTRNSMLNIPYTRLLPKLGDDDKLKHLKAVAIDKSHYAKPRSLQQAIGDKLRAIKDKQDAHLKAKIKYDEDRRALRQQNAAQQSTMPSKGYSRYEQEKTKRDRTEIYGLDMIDQTVSLNTLTGPGDAPKAPTAAQNASRKINNSSELETSPIKSTSKTPIILIPAAITSMITMSNAKYLLEELRYLSPTEAQAELQKKGITRPVDVSVKRPYGPPIVYRVIDNPQKLRDDQWKRVVAVFVQGKAWQFKGYKIPDAKSDVADIFHQVCGLHVKTDDMRLEPSIGQWNVKVISLNSMKAHDHKHRLKQIWEEIDKFVRMSSRLSKAVSHP